MQFTKPVKWGVRFSFPENAEFVQEDLVCKATEKMYAHFIDEYDTYIVSQIANTARANGISDLTILNKAAILGALEKQIPKKPRDIWCVSCGNVVHNRMRYCDQCGQAIDWRNDNANL